LKKILVLRAAHFVTLDSLAISDTLAVGHLDMFLLSSRLLFD